jgi:hypothetical protein
MGGSFMSNASHKKRRKAVEAAYKTWVWMTWKYFRVILRSMLRQNVAYVSFCLKAHGKTLISQRQFNSICSYQDELWHSVSWAFARRMSYLLQFNCASNLLSNSVRNCCAGLRQQDSEYTSVNALMIQCSIDVLCRLNISSHVPGRR